MAGGDATPLEWRCPKCDGDGFLLTEDGEAVACECRAARVKRARSRGVSSVIPRKYRGVSFDRAPVPELEQLNPYVVREVRRFLHQLDKRLEQGKGMWITGDVGTGKSTLAMLISKAALSEGHSVAIYSVPQLLATIRDTYSAERGEYSYLDFFRRLTRVDLLHLEDLGAEKQTDWVLEQLYSLVNQRYEDERSIVATTNLRYDQLEEQIGARTASRLAEICGELWPLCGPDQRVANPEQLDEPLRSSLG
jgi:DNA replication protein DnaC